MRRREGVIRDVYRRVNSVEGNEMEKTAGDVGRASNEEEKKEGAGIKEET